MEKNKTRRSFERNKGRSFDYKISDIWIYKSFDFFEGNCLFWNLVVGFKRSVKMFQKTFEVLQAIDDLATEYYEKIKTDCDTYEDLEKGLRGMSYVDFGRFNTSRDYLVKVMRQKIKRNLVRNGGRAMYLEERVEHLEKQIEELKEQKKNELYLSPAQFAEKMSCSRSMVTKLVQNGEIEALRLGKLIRIPMSQFEEKEESKKASWKDVVFKGA